MKLFKRKLYHNNAKHANEIDKIMRYCIFATRVEWKMYKKVSAHRLKRQKKRKRKKDRDTFLYPSWWRWSSSVHVKGTKACISKCLNLYLCCSCRSWPVCRYMFPWRCRTSCQTCCSEDLQTPRSPESLRQRHKQPEQPLNIRLQQNQTHSLRPW